ncbi:hypothetical protein AB0H12_27865 [Actinosynnema sp. NPDC023794]
MIEMVWFLLGLLVGLASAAVCAYYLMLELRRTPPDRAELEVLRLRAEAAEAALRVAQAGQLAEHQLIMRAFPSPADMPSRRPGGVRHDQAG